MVKVLYKETLPVFIITCGRCRSFLEFDETDEHFIYSENPKITGKVWSFQQGDESIVFKILCPICHSEIVTRELVKGEYSDYRMNDNIE